MITTIYILYTAARCLSSILTRHTDASAKSGSVGTASNYRIYRADRAARIKHSVVVVSTAAMVGATAAMLAAATATVATGTTAIANAHELTAFSTRATVVRRTDISRHRVAVSRFVCAAGLVGNISGIRYSFHISPPLHRILRSQPRPPPSRGEQSLFRGRRRNSRCRSA